MTDKRRKTPIRTCVACRTASTKGNLIRIVRSPQGEVRIDESGKMPGRGAYVCRRKECIAPALKYNRLTKALRCSIPEHMIKQIHALVVEDDGK